VRLYILVLLLLCKSVTAQETSDSVRSIQGILLKGYETNAGTLKIPASVSYLNRKSIQAVSTYSLLPAFNQIAGVRMEERSPGSYRLSIRGSLLRSPFGVRNIKVYLDEFLLTDAGGNTYINLLDANMVGQAEVIKGPAGSMYGAGTGGAVLLGGNDLLPAFSTDSSTFRGMISGGRFGAFNEAIQYQVNKKNTSLSISQGHAQATGFRDQSALRKDNVLLRLKTQPDSKMSSELMVLLSDLEYETPGGLNLAQRNSNPRQARPAAGIFPSTEAQKTAIFNQTALLGFTSRYKISEKWQLVSSFTTGLTRFKNPFISNYEKRNESNVGLRTKFVYERKGAMPVQWVSGFEIQRGGYRIDSTGNKQGVPTGSLVRDEVIARQQFLFTQLNWSLLKVLRLQTGLSLNNFAYSIERTIGLPANGKVPVDFKLQLLPRVALLFEPWSGLGVYGQLSKGYSSPGIAEIRPSAGGLYSGLQAEYGWNKEIGIKWLANNGKIQLTAALFQFNLKDAIVRQTNSAGAEFFVNAGSTRQKGFEGEVSILLLNRPLGSVFQRILWTQSITLNDFSFGQYISAGSDFSGKRIAGVPDELYGLTAQVGFLKRFELHVNFSYASRIPLTDANVVYADPYRLWTGRLSWNTKFKKVRTSLFLLVDNIGNINYSLGNDLNAFGSRYYNPSPTRNLQIGANFSL
jgi:iron complex outermembrane receptor protein